MFNYITAHYENWFLLLFYLAAAADKETYQIEYGAKNMVQSRKWTFAILQDRIIKETKKVLVHDCTTFGVDLHICGDD